MRYSNKYLVIFDLSQFSITKSGRPISTLFLPFATKHLFSHGEFSDKISSLANLMKTPLSKVAFLNDQNTFWLLDYHFVQSDLVGSGFLKA